MQQINEELNAALKALSEGGQLLSSPKEDVGHDYPAFCVRAEILDIDVDGETHRCVVAKSKSGSTWRLAKPETIINHPAIGSLDALVERLNNGKGKARMFKTSKRLGIWEMISKADTSAEDEISNLY